MDAADEVWHRPHGPRRDRTRAQEERRQDMTVDEIREHLAAEGFERDTIGTETYQRGNLTIEVRTWADHVVTRHFGTMIRQTISYLSPERFQRHLDNETEAASGKLNSAAGR